MTQFYAGVGNRKAPEPILDLIKVYATVMRLKGYTLRSGGAVGPDKHFQHYAGLKKEIIWALESHRYPAWYEMAERYHGGWHNCDEDARRFLARNCAIVLGYDLATPVEFVIAWTPGGAVTGGTGHTIRIAKAHNIPVYNLASRFDCAELEERIF